MFLLSHTGMFMDWAGEYVHVLSSCNCHPQNKLPRNAQLKRTMRNKCLASALHLLLACFSKCNHTALLQ
jgi:hypothetical protein